MIDYVNVSAMCQSKGGYLVVVDSIEKEAIVENLIRIHSQTEASYLIGMLYYSKSSSYCGIAIHNTLIGFTFTNPFQSFIQYFYDFFVALFSILT